MYFLYRGGWGYDHWMNWNVLLGRMRCQRRRKMSRMRCVEVGHLRLSSCQLFLLSGDHCWRHQCAQFSGWKGWGKDSEVAKFNRSAEEEQRWLELSGEDYMHCWPSSNVASDLTTSPFKSLFLFRNHICRSIWFGSFRVSDHIKSVYYTGREAEVGWGRRARWRAKKWWWRTCSMLLL